MEGWMESKTASPEIQSQHESADAAAASWWELSRQDEGSVPVSLSWGNLLWSRSDVKSALLSSLRFRELCWKERSCLLVLALSTSTGCPCWGQNGPRKDAHMAPASSAINPDLLMEAAIQTRILLSGTLMATKLRSILDVWVPFKPGLLSWFS